MGLHKQLCLVFRLVSPPLPTTSSQFRMATSPFLFMLTGPLIGKPRTRQLSPTLTSLSLLRASYSTSFKVSKSQANTSLLCQPSILPAASSSRHTSLLTPSIPSSPHGLRLVPSLPGSTPLRFPPAHQLSLPPLALTL